MADESDVLARLSRVLETQSLGFGSDLDASSTQEILAKLSGEIGDVSIAESRDEGGYSRSIMAGKVQMPNRKKTPYEVWAESQMSEVVKVSSAKSYSSFKCKNIIVTVRQQKRLF